MACSNRALVIHSNIRYPPAPPAFGNLSYVPALHLCHGGLRRLLSSHAEGHDPTAHLGGEQQESV
ncbi:hypothetical protein EJB05_09443 [Eragrostis curvula]|uniref:Uncharacterized protein n=1 Tax=Eragrostis curvula TaxID=38414 RepID=A0A5J9W509_9POAL|nr:hypothetical protein EJB05_09443 [Eragrostis curvula]